MPAISAISFSYYLNYRDYEDEMSSLINIVGVFNLILYACIIVARWLHLTICKDKQIQQNPKNMTFEFIILKQILFGSIMVMSSLILLTTFDLYLDISISNNNTIVYPIISGIWMFIILISVGISLRIFVYFSMKEFRWLLAKGYCVLLSEEEICL